MELENCAICGGRAVDPHHLTGRGSDRLQLDPDLTAPLCHDDHELIHEDLRTEGPRQAHWFHDRRRARGSSAAPSGGVPGQSGRDGPAASVAGRAGEGDTALGK